jgi:hypothetical protein
MVRACLTCPPSLTPVFAKMSLRKCRFQDGGGADFTGWHAASFMDWDWHNGNCHTSWGAPEQQLAIACCTVTSILINLTAKREKASQGGYFYTGTCTDSAAVVEAAVSDNTSSTLFPLGTRGQAKAALVKVASELQAGSDSQSNASQFRIILKRVVDALDSLPNDMDIPPADITDACRRLAATLPSSSPFAIVDRSRDKVSQLGAHWAAVAAAAR